MKRTLPFPLPDGDDALFCLVRHGETDWNRDKRIQGHLDVPLNDTGRRQALAVRRARAGIPFAAHYASDLARTLETLGPARVLARGYAIVRDEKARVITRAADAGAARAYEIELADGRLAAPPDRRRGGAGAAPPKPRQGSLF